MGILFRRNPIPGLAPPLNAALGLLIAAWLSSLAQVGHVLVHELLLLLDDIFLLHQVMSLTDNDTPRDEQYDDQHSSFPASMTS
jgi:hypothetical protein